LLKAGLVKSSTESVIATHDNAVLSLADVARDHILRTLELVDGNKARAARLLGVSRRALYRQLERHGLHRREPQSQDPR
jgi:transcriptional regulator of acetoin/glycerol metabolism